MESLLMGSIFGFSLLSFVAYLLIVLKIDYLFIPLVIFVLFSSHKPIFHILKNFKFRLETRSLITILIFLVGILGQLAVIAPSGIYKNGDLVFWSSHGHDGAWHIALMEEINKGFPFQNPVFSNLPLKNYHFFSDLLPALVNKYTHISNENLYFRIFPLIYSLFLGVSAFYLTKKITKNLPTKTGYIASLWATIFTYFAGSFGYFIGKGESVFWATQPQSSGGNPPQIISNFLFLTAIYYVLTFLDQKEKKLQIKYFLVSLILLGTISAFKIYAGVILLMTLSAIGVWMLIFKKDMRLFLLTLISGIIALALYLPNSSSGGSFLILEPWWYIRTMIVEPSRLNLLDWELRRQTYLYEHNFKRVIFLEGLGFLIFFFGNLGMRFLGLWEFIKTKAIFKIAIILSLSLPLLFLQKGVASNTAQFLQYYILLFGILAGIGTSKLLTKVKNPIFNFLISIFIFSLMIPTQIVLIKDFYGRPPFAKISVYELEALRFVKNNTDPKSVILTPPYNQYIDLRMATPHIWDWFDTSYVSAISARRTYFDDYEQVDIMGYDYKDRLQDKRIIFESDNPVKVEQAIKRTGANLLYFPKVLSPKVDINKIDLTLIYQNQDVEVWRIN